MIDTFPLQEHFQHEQTECNVFPTAVALNLLHSSWACGSLYIRPSIRNIIAYYKVFSVHNSVKYLVCASFLVVSLVTSGCGQDNDILDLVCQSPRGNFQLMTIKINIASKTVQQMTDLGDGCLLESNFADGEHKTAALVKNCPFALSNDASDLILRVDDNKIEFGDSRSPQTLDRTSGVYRGSGGMMAQCSKANIDSRKRF